MKINLLLTCLTAILFTVSCVTVEVSDIEVQSVSEVYREYPSHIIKVYDGDTVTAVLDLGFGVELEESIRLYGIDTPEIRGEERPMGLLAREYLSERILGQDVIIFVPAKERGKYGRILGVIEKDGVNINQELLDKGLAELYY